jgi:hypothetical protein
MDVEKRAGSEAASAIRSTFFPESGVQLLDVQRS